MKLALILVPCLAFAPAAFGEDYARRGVTAGVGGSFAIENFDDDLVDFDDGGAFDVMAGYRAHPNFEADLHYSFLTGFESDSFPGGGDFELEGSVLTANAKLIVMTGQVQPYLSAGGGWAWLDLDGPGGDSDLDDPIARFGIGVDTYVNENFAIGLEGAYHLGADDIDDFDFWTVTGLLKFKF